MHPWRFSKFCIKPWATIYILTAAAEFLSNLTHHVIWKRFFFLFQFTLGDKFWMWLFWPHFLLCKECCLQGLRWEETSFQSLMQSHHAENYYQHKSYLPIPKLGPFVYVHIFSFNGLTSPAHKLMLCCESPSLFPESIHCWQEKLPPLHAWLIFFCLFFIKTLRTMLMSRWTESIDGFY